MAFILGGVSVALRFQDKGDDIDREVKQSRPGFGCALLLAIVFGAFFFACDVFISGKSIADASRRLGEFAVVVAAVLALEWFVTPKYQEFRVRSKEILGTVTEIEEAVSEIREDQEKLLERLRAVEEELRSLKCQE
jgi:hypothetical protein